MSQFTYVQIYQMVLWALFCPCLLSPVASQLARIYVTLVSRYQWRSADRHLLFRAPSYATDEAWCPGSDPCRCPISSASDTAPWPQSPHFHSLRWPNLSFLSVGSSSRRGWQKKVLGLLRCRLWQTLAIVLYSIALCNFGPFCSYFVFSRRPCSISI